MHTVQGQLLSTTWEGAAMCQWETHPAVLLLNAGSLATGYAIIIQADRSSGLIGCGVARWCTLLYTYMGFSWVTPCFLENWTSIATHTSSWLHPGCDSHDLNGIWSVNGIHLFVLIDKVDYARVYEWHWTYCKACFSTLSMFVNIWGMPQSSWLRLIQRGHSYSVAPGLLLQVVDLCIPHIIKLTGRDF